MPVQEIAPEVVPLKTNKNRKEVPQVTLFTIDDVEYKIPSKVRPNVSLKIMNVFRLQGETAGVDYMLETVLGTESYAALKNFDDLEDDQLESIIKIAFKLISGVTENPKA